MRISFIDDVGGDFRCWVCYARLVLEVEVDEIQEGVLLRCGIGIGVKMI